MQKPEQVAELNVHITCSRDNKEQCAYYHPQAVSANCLACTKFVPQDMFLDKEQLSQIQIAKNLPPQGKSSILQP